MTPTPHHLSDRYELGETLGFGGMSEVHFARDTLLNRDVAVRSRGPTSRAIRRSTCDFAAKRRTPPNSITRRSSRSSTPANPRPRAARCRSSSWNTSTARPCATSCAATARSRRGR